MYSGRIARGRRGVVRVGCRLGVTGPCWGKGPPSLEGKGGTVLVLGPLRRFAVWRNLVPRLLSTRHLGPLSPTQESSSDREVFYTFLWRGWVEAQVICVDILTSGYWYLSGNLQQYVWGARILVQLKFLSDSEGWGP